MQSYDAYQHLMEEQVWVNHLVSEYIAEMRHAKTYRRFENFSGLYISDEEIDAIIEDPDFLNLPASGKKYRGGSSAKEIGSGKLRPLIDKKAQRATESDVFLPLHEIRQRFDLNATEYQVFLLCLVCELDARYEKLYAYLQNDLTKRTPGVNLIMDLLRLGSEARLQHLDIFHPDGLLRRLGLVISDEPSAEASITLQHFRVPLRVVSYVLKSNRTESRLLPYVRFFTSLDWEHVVIEDDLRSRVETLFQDVVAASKGGGPRLTLFLHGRPGVGKKTVARALAGSLGKTLGVVDLQLLVKNPASFREQLRLVMREGILKQCVVCLEHFEKLEEKYSTDPDLLQTLIQEVNDTDWITILCSENSLPIELLDRSAVCAIEVPFPDYRAQRVLWNMHMQGLNADGEGSVDHLTARYSLAGGQIASAVRFAEQAARVRNPQRVEVPLSDLAEGARRSSQPRLSTLARKIQPNYRWEDLVLPADQLQQLQALTSQVKQKQRVLHEWGFADKLSLGRGLNALFAGPSGTGKTMSAEVIANDLELDLYKINLSTVVSKYIGETEKNLNRIFDEAEHSNAILFFDEADALFGKRSEVKDAHDRYSNIEIAFLLQRMEEYDGISILATNLRQNIDEAFTRRLRFIVDFPFPDETYRWRIWQKIWPQNMPVDDDVDLEFMARQFEVTGGSIRNIALAAAFRAARNGRSVTMKHVLYGTKQELQKMGKICIKEDFGAYQHLV